MSRTAQRLTGTGTGGIFADGDLFKLTANGQPLKHQIDLDLAAVWFRNKYVGGSDVDGIDALSTGDVELRHWIPWEIDNASDQLTGFTDANGASLIVRVRYFIRVSSSGITFTPKVLYGSISTALTSIASTATISGQSACSATSSTYNGSAQVQDVLVTAPTGLKWFKAMGTIGGTPSTGDQVWARAEASCYVSLP